MLISLSVDFHSGDLKTRERFHLTEESVARLLGRPLDGSISELAFLATCNRLELFAVADETAPESTLWRDLAQLWMGDGLEGPALLRLGHRRRGEEVVRHLLRVAAGLESQVLGDSQVLGQVRTAYRQADDAGTLGPVLHRLFDQALHAAKRVQHETSLVGGRQSVAAEAANTVAQRLAPLGRRRCLVVGCGKTGERAARQLVKFGAADIVLINRTAARAAELAAQLWGRAAPLEALHREAAQADVVIVATGAEKPMLHADALAFCREQLRGPASPTLVIDLAMPRNVDPGVGSIPGITLIDLDLLHPPVAEAEAVRRAAVPRAERIVDEETTTYMLWLATAPAREALKPLRLVLQELCRREVAFAAGQSAADRAADRIVAKLMARPMIAMRNASQRGESVDDLADAVRRLFGPAPASAIESMAESEPR